MPLMLGRAVRLRIAVICLGLSMAGCSSEPAPLIAVPAPLTSDLPSSSLTLPPPEPVPCGLTTPTLEIDTFQTEPVVYDGTTVTITVNPPDGDEQTIDFAFSGADFSPTEAFTYFAAGPRPSVEPTGPVYPAGVVPQTISATFQAGSQLRLTSEGGDDRYPSLVIFCMPED